MAQGQETVGELFELALGHLADSKDPAKSEEDQAYARGEFENARDFIYLWRADTTNPGLAQLAMRFEYSAQFHDARSKRLRREAEVGPIQTMHEILERRPEIARFVGQDGTTHAEIRAAQFAEGLEEGLGTGNLGDERLSGTLVQPLDQGIKRHFWQDGFELDSKLASLPAQATDELLYANQLFRGEIKTREDGSRYVDTDWGERDYIDLNSGSTYQVELADGTQAELKASHRLLEEVIHKRAGGWLAGSIANSAIYAGQFFDSLEGTIPLPKITGDEMLDRALMQDVMVQRAVFDARGHPSAVVEAINAAYGLAEFAGTMALTRGAGRLLAPAGTRALGLAQKLGAGGRAARFTGLMSKGVGKALIEGGRMAHPARTYGTHFDFFQVGEMVWYESVRGALTGTWDAKRQVTDGVEAGMSLYALGRVSRGARALFGTFMLSGLAGKSMQRWAAKGLPSGIEQAGYEAALSQTKRELIEQAARKGLLDAQRGAIRRDAIGSFVDTAFVGWGLGTWAGAQGLAANDGKEWSALGLSERMGYLARGATSATAMASMVGMVGGHAAVLGASRKQRRALRGEGPEIDKWLKSAGTRVAAMVEDFKADKTVLDHVSQLFGGMEADPEVRAIVGARLDAFRGVAKSATAQGAEFSGPLSKIGEEGLVKAFRSEKGQEAFEARTMLESAEGLDALESRLRLVDPLKSGLEEFWPVRDMLQAVESERLRRAQGGTFGAEMAKALGRDPAEVTPEPKPAVDRATRHRLYQLRWPREDVHAMTVERASEILKKREVGPGLAVATFTTERGSTYTVHDGDTTIRNKASRPEHPGEAGLQPRSQRTVYVEPQAAQLLGEVQTQGGKPGKHLEVLGGEIAMVYGDGTVERRTAVPFKRRPEVGLLPVELWAGKTPHFGNRIIEVGPGPRPKPPVTIAGEKQPEPGVERTVSKATGPLKSLSDRELVEHYLAHPDEVSGGIEMLRRSFRQRAEEESAREDARAAEARSAKAQVSEKELYEKELGRWMGHLRHPHRGRNWIEKIAPLVESPLTKRAIEDVLKVADLEFQTRLEQDREIHRMADKVNAEELAKIAADMEARGIEPVMAESLAQAEQFAGELDWYNAAVLRDRATEAQAVEQASQRAIPPPKKLDRGGFIGPRRPRGRPRKAESEQRTETLHPLGATEAGVVPMVEMVGAGAAEQARRAPDPYERTLADTVADATLAVGRHRALLRDLSTLEENGQPLVRDDPALASRDQVTLMRRLFDRDGELEKTLLANGWEPSDIAAAQENARLVSGAMQQMVRDWTLRHTGPDGVRLLEGIVRALEYESKGEPIPDDVAAALGGFIENGRLKLSIENQLIERAFHALREAIRESGDPETIDLVGKLDVALEKLGPQGRLMLYGGLPPLRDLSSMVAGVLNYATGFHDRMLGHRGRDDFEVFSARGKLTLRTFLDWLKERPYFRTRSGEEMAKLVFPKILRVWQAIPGRGRSAGTSEFGLAGLGADRARIDAQSVARDLSLESYLLTRRVEDMGLSTLEAAVMGRAVSAGLKRQIQTADEFEAAVPGYRHLWDAFVDVNAHLYRFGKALAERGLISEEARARLEEGYLPERVLEIVSSTAEGLAVRRKMRGGFRIGGPEMPRRSKQTPTAMMRLYDIRQLLPAYAQAMSRRLELWAGIEGYRDLGGAVSEVELSKMSPLAQSQFMRIASPGKEGLDSLTGRPAPEITAEELKQAELRPDGPAWLARLVRERSKTTEAQAKVWELILAEESAHDGLNGHPTMTPKMRELIDFLKSGYVTVHGSEELSLLIDRTELGDPNRGFGISDFVQQATMEWRAARTLYNLRHWALQMGTNWSSNAMTGKVPMHDFMDPGGVTQQSWGLLGEYHSYLNAGRPKEGSTWNTKLVEEFIKYGGGDGLTRMILAPLDGGAIFGEQLQAMTGAERRYDGTSQGLIGEFLNAQHAAKGGLATLSEKLDKMAGSPNPALRAESQRAAVGLYSLIDMSYRLAGTLRGLRRGMDMRSAVEWASEGVGDYNNRNTWVYRLTTQFSTRQGILAQRARVRLGKGPFIGEAGPGAGVLTKAATIFEPLLYMGLGSPFWMYKASMLPTVTKAAFNHPAKALTSLAAMTYLIQVVGRAFGGDPSDFEEEQAGRGSFLRRELRPADYDYLEKNYGDSEIALFGTLRLAGKDWWRALKAAAGGDFARLFTAEGPTAGGERSSLDFKDFVPLLGWYHDMAQTGMRPFESRPFEPGPEGASRLGVAFLPTVIASNIARGFELAHGVEGKSDLANTVAALQEWTQSYASPLGGFLPPVFSREVQDAVSVLSWNGRSLADVIDNLPARRLPAGLGAQAAQIAARTTLPMRRVPSTSTMPREGGGLLEGALEFFGAQTRPAPPGKGPERAASLRASLGKKAILNLASQAFRRAYDTGLPVSPLYEQAFGLDRDIVWKDGEASDVVESPQTEIGRFIRQSAATPEGRAEWIATIAEQLRSHRDELVAAVDGPQGLAHLTGVTPAIHDRSLEAVWDGAENPGRMLDFFFRVTHDQKLRRTWAADGDGVWYRLWHDLGMAYRIRSRSGANLSRLKAVERWMSHRSFDLEPEYNLRGPVTPKELIEAAGARAVDVFPSQYRETLKPRTIELLLGR